MFQGAKSFNQDISGWDMVKVVDGDGGSDGRSPCPSHNHCQRCCRSASHSPMVMVVMMATALALATTIAMALVLVLAIALW